MEATHGVSRRLRETFTQGGCVDLALELNRVTGWPMYGEVLSSIHGSIGPEHLWVLNPDGNAVDINGVNQGNFAEAFDPPRPLKDRKFVAKFSRARAKQWSNGFGKLARVVARAFPSHFGVTPAGTRHRTSMRGGTDQ